MDDNILTTTHLTDVEIEKALLGRLFVDPGTLELCRAERLVPIMFGIARHNWIFDAMVTLNKAGDEIDPRTIANELERRDQQIEELYDGYLEDLRDNHGAEIPVRTYAKEVRVLHEWRSLVAHGDYVRDLAAKRGDGISPVTAWSQIKSRADKTRPYEPNQNFTYGADTFEVYHAMRDEMLEQGLSWGQPFKNLEAEYGMAQPGDTFGIIGPTGSGKSAAMSSVAEFYSEFKGMRTAYIYTEMRLKKVLDRRMAKHSGIDYRRLKSPVELTDGELEMMRKSEGKVMDWAHKLDYLHKQSPAASDLLATIERMCEELNTQVFIIDHANDINVEGYNAGAKNWELFFIDLEALCNKCGIIAWVAAQMNRNSGDGKAYMIGQAFDNKLNAVMELQPKILKANYTLVYGGHEYKYLAGRKSPIVDVYFRKMREGEPFRDDLLFVGSRYLYADTPKGIIRPIV